MNKPKKRSQRKDTETKMQRHRQKPHNSIGNRNIYANDCETKKKEPCFTFVNCVWVRAVSTEGGSGSLELEL